MKKNKEEKIYCVFCGEENPSKEKKCQSCGKKLNPHNHLFRDYLKDHIKDHIKEDAEDSIIQILKLWIIEHLYGVAITGALIFSVATIISTEIKAHRIKETISPVLAWKGKQPEVAKDICLELDLVNQEKTCEEGFVLQENMCIREYTVPASVNSSCSAGYYPGNNICISNDTIPKVSVMSCTAANIPEGRPSAAPERVIGSILQGGKCYVQFCMDRVNDAGVAWSPGDACNNIELYENEPVYTSVCNAYEESDGSCRTTTNLIYSYFCSDGDLIGTECHLTEEKEVQFTCPENTEYHETCKKCERKEG